MRNHVNVIFVLITKATTVVFMANGLNTKHTRTTCMHTHTRAHAHKVKVSSCRQTDMLIPVLVHVPVRQVLNIKPTIKSYKHYYLRSDQ